MRAWFLGARVPLENRIKCPRLTGEPCVGGATWLRSKDHAPLMQDNGRDPFALTNRVGVSVSTPTPPRWRKFSHGSPCATQLAQPAP